MQLFHLLASRLVVILVLVLGVANLLADGLSMGVGNYLGIRSDERVREAQLLPEQEAFPIRHGVATFMAFMSAGSVPLAPYVFSVPLFTRVSTTRRPWSDASAMTGLRSLSRVTRRVATVPSVPLS